MAYNNINANFTFYLKRDVIKCDNVIKYMRGEIYGKW